LDLIVDGIIYLNQKFGGISRIYTETLPRLCDLEPELTITLLAYPKVSPERLPQHKRITLRSIPDVYRHIRPYRFWRPYYSQLSKLATRALLGRSKGKIWCSTYYTSPIAWAGPQVFVAYDFVYEKYRQEYWQNELSGADKVIQNKAAAISKADLVICISEATRQDLMELYHVPDHKAVVVHLAHKSSFTLLDEAVDLQKDKFLLYVGNRIRYKRFDILLRAYANWPSRFKIGLVCVGGGEWTDPEKQELSRYGLDNHVTLLPQVDDQHLCRLYNQASAFIYPSQYEGFGIPLLEAMACGCPIIASRIPSSVEVAESVPFFFTPGNLDELLVALDQAMSEGRSTPRTTEGLALARHFSWENTARGFLQALRALE